MWSVGVQRSGERINHRRIETGGGGYAEVWLEQTATRVGMRTEYKGPTFGGSGGSGGWDKCGIAECLGVRVPGQQKCLLHVDGDVRDSYYQQVAGGRSSLQLSGIVVPEDLWLEVIAKLSEKGGQAQIVPATISAGGAVFPFRIRHQDLTFQRQISFTGATLEGGVDLNGCTFTAGLNLDYVDFANASVTFWDCTFGSSFSGSYGQADKQYVAFTSCEMTGDAQFNGFVGDLRFDQCTIKGALEINQGSFTHLSLQKLRLAGQLNVNDLEGQSVYFSGAILESAKSIGPATIDSSDFAGATFRARVQIFLRGKRAQFHNAVWQQGGRLEVENAQVGLESVVLGGPLALIGKGTASLVSIRDADAGAMSVSNMDLSRCIFSGAHRLQDTSLDTTVRLADAPRWRARRRCVVDECGWRARHARWRGRDWITPGTYLAAKEDDPDAVVLPDLSPAEVSRVYRSLRKGLEGAANEAGSADFYYGEMEMRRFDKQASLVERMIVTAYWLASGYGLRASRAFFWLAVLVLLGAVALHEHGFVTQDVSIGGSILAAVECVLPGVTTSYKLTDWGRTTDIVLTVVGPVLLGLAALALRNRVKR
jgi:uncharacterized protein YjbI with pentapeptide repeats